MSSTAPPLDAAAAAALSRLTAARAAGRPCPPVRAPGDRFTAEIGGLGTVTAQFS